MNHHLVFYDGECGLCDNVVQFLLKHDKENVFLFAPLQGTTAQKIPPHLKSVDSIVLIENYLTPNERMFIQGKAAWRVLWLLGGAWRLLGWINFLPAFLYDWGYRLVARNRHRIFSNEACVLPDPSNKSRFLP